MEPVDDKNQVSNTADDSLLSSDDYKTLIGA
jgi:hypothetical protein